MKLRFERSSVRFFKSYRYIYIIACLVLGILLSLTVAFSHRRWGLQARYYVNMQWEGEPAVVRIDPIPFLAGKEGDNILSAPVFSVTWNGWITIEKSGTYRFATESDDGSYLRINGQTIVDNGGAHGLQKVTGEIELHKGIYPLEIQYFQIGGYSVMQTFWTPPEAFEELLPVSVLFSGRPKPGEIFLRTAVQFVLANASVIFWGGLCIFFIIIVLRAFRSFGIVPHFTQRIRQSYLDHKVTFGMIGLSLFGILLIRYMSINSPVENSPKSPWIVQANSHSDEAVFAVDRQFATVWTADFSVTPDSFFYVDFHKPVRIEKFLLLHGHTSVDNASDGYSVDISEDNVTWKPTELTDYQTFDNAAVLYIHPVRARYVRIWHLRNSRITSWSIYELYVYHSAWLPRSYRPTLLWLFSCGVIGGICFLSLSLLKRFQTCHRIILPSLSCAIAIGFFLRMFMLQYHDLNGDEITYLLSSVGYYDSELEWMKHTFNTNHRMTALFHLFSTRWLSKIVGISSLSIRLLPAILGTLTIYAIFHLWYHVSSRKEKCFEAFLSACFVAILPYHVCWSRDGHGQIQMTFFYILYLVISTKIFTARITLQKVFWGSLVCLFSGFFFHGSMLVAPIGIVLFAFLDMLFTTCKLPRWQPFSWKQYLPLAVSSFVLFGYLFYILIIRGGLADTSEYANISASSNVRAIPQIIDFLQARWDLLLQNWREPWWHLYNVPPYFSGILLGILIVGLGDMLFCRQKTEWFVIIQATFFCISISSLWATSDFERFLHPSILPIAYALARGITVISTWMRGRRSVMIIRTAMGLVLLVSLGIISIDGLFFKQSETDHTIYRFYGGRSGTFFQMTNALKLGKRGLHNIMFLAPWKVDFYNNTFKLNFQYLPPSDFIDRVRAEQILPGLIILGSEEHEDGHIIEILEQRYNFVGTTFHTDDSFYELRMFPSASVTSQFAETQLSPSVNPLTLRRDPALLSRDEVILMLQEKGFHHPDDLSQYGFAGRITGSVQHQYTLHTLHGQKVIVDHTTGLLWQHSGSSAPMNWKKSRKYIESLNVRRYAGYADWRLPTLEELASLIEPSKQDGDVYIHPIFDPQQVWCWSADSVKGPTPHARWIVHFYNGNVSYRNMRIVFYVRAVRTLRENDL